MTGYRIYYNDGTNQGSQDAGASATDLTITVPQPQSSLTYSITIVALSTHLPSTVVDPVVVTVGKQQTPFVLLSIYLPILLLSSIDPPPTASTLTPGATTPTSVVVSWNQQPSADTYEISFERATGSQQAGECPSFEHTGNVPDVTGTATMYTLTGLHEFSTYFITVTAVSSVTGRSESSRLIATTQIAGMYSEPSFTLK